jgi:hypothetical protein
MSDVGLLRRLAGLADPAVEELAFVWRMQRTVRGIEWELAEGTIDAFARLIRSERKVVSLINEIDLAHAMLRKNPDAALAKMMKASNNWLTLKDELLAAARGGRQQTEELVAAIEDHFGRRMNAALDVSAHGLPANTRLAGKRMGASSIIPRKTRALMADAALKAARSPEGKTLGAELLNALQTLRKDLDPGAKREVLDKFFRYLKEPEDPAWASLAELINRGGRKAELTIQGKIGECIAMRTPWVWELFEDAYAEASAIARRLEKAGFEAHLVDIPSHALTSRRGMAEIYDGSVWLLRKEPKPPIAVPVMICQVKSGSVDTAIRQIANSDLRREFGATIRFETEPGKFMEFEITAPSKELGFESFETRRVLVASSPPSDHNISKQLKPGMAVDFTELPFTKEEMHTLRDVMLHSDVRKALDDVKRAIARKAASP